MPRDINGFLKSPHPKAHVILVYGPDHGLMKERITTLAKHIVTDLNDPFNVTTLTAAQISDDPSHFFDEANALSMLGDKRVIRVRDASDKLAVHLKTYLEAPNPDTLVLIEGDDLGPRSSLRKLCEGDDHAAALPCYTDEARDKSTVIREMIQQAQIRIEPDALGWLAQNIHGDRARLRSEIEKLILYGLETKQLNLADVQLVCADAGTAALDQCIENTAGQNTALALNLYNTLLEEGINFVIILRSLQNYFKRLHQAKSKVQNGQNIDSAMKSLSPPVFFKQANAFKMHCTRWSHQNLLTALEKLQQLESDCKKTGAMPDILCGQAILALSKMQR